MKKKEAQLVLDEKAVLGEGPAWDKKSKRLFWVDIEDKKVHIYDPEDNSDRVIEVEKRVGAVVPRAQGGAVMALEDGFAFLDLETEVVEYIAKVEAENSSTRFNDGKCDPAGRFWAGTMNTAGSDSIGNLYYLDTNHNIKKMVENVGTSNGLAWSPDRETMYYIDTPTRQVVAYDYDKKTGAIENKRVVVTIPEDQGKPDGMNIDTEGNIWVAHWQGYQVSCWNPESGEKLVQIEVPVARVTSCCFGGDNLNDLYITTAKTGLKEEELKQQPHAGSLFKVKTEVQGDETFQFQG